MAVAELYAQVGARGRTCTPARTGGGAERPEAAASSAGGPLWVGTPNRGLLFPRRITKSPRSFLLPLMESESRSGQEIRSGTTSFLTSVVTFQALQSLENSGKIGGVF